MSEEGVNRVCRGTRWVEPCRAAKPDENGFRAHYYHRPVISADHFNDLRRVAQEVFDAAGNGEDALADALVKLGLALAGE